MKSYVVSFFTFMLHTSSSTLLATTITIGMGKDYISPNSMYNANVLMDGDTILIDAGSYTGNSALCVWQKNNLVIKGLPGRPHMAANGANIWGKGTWVFAGNNISVENIEFSGAAVQDQNGAGIRLDGSGMTVKHCYFHHNENGILTSNPGTGEILVEHSEFAYNGFGDGQSHNLYIGRVEKLTFRYNYSHHAKIGHNLKSRAKVNAILYNRIMDESDGTSSYLVDLSNGGASLVMGNLMMQGQQTDNCNMVAYALEGFGVAYEKQLYFVHNTMVNKRSPGCSFINLNASSLGMVANNIMAGPGSVSSNPIDTTGNLRVTNPVDAGFVNEFLFDYRLAQNSPAINFCTTLTNPPLWNLQPDKIYQHAVSTAGRMTMGQPDAGAYEFESVLAIDNKDAILIPDQMTQEAAFIYPNPASSHISIKNRKLYLGDFIIIDINGAFIMSGNLTGSIDISHFPEGIYFLKANLKKEGKSVAFPFVKL